MKTDKRKDERQPEVETPRPPQVMDTSRPPELENEETSTKNEVTADEKKADTPEKKQEQPKKKKLLGESPLEIDDETTI